MHQVLGACITRSSFAAVKRLIDITGASRPTTAAVAMVASRRVTMLPFLSASAARVAGGVTRAATRFIASITRVPERASRRHERVEEYSETA